MVRRTRREADRHFLFYFCVFRHGTSSKIKRFDVWLFLQVSEGFVLLNVLTGLSYLVFECFVAQELFDWVEQHMPDKQF